MGTSLPSSLGFAGHIPSFAWIPWTYEPRSSMASTGFPCRRESGSRDRSSRPDCRALRPEPPLRHGPGDTHHVVRAIQDVGLDNQGRNFDLASMIVYGEEVQVTYANASAGMSKES